MSVREAKRLPGAATRLEEPILLHLRLWMRKGGKPPCNLPG